jgi:hypothetical protein
MDEANLLALLYEIYLIYFPLGLSVTRFSQYLHEIKFTAFFQPMGYTCHFTIKLPMNKPISTHNCFQFCITSDSLMSSPVQQSF